MRVATALVLVAALGAPSLGGASRSGAPTRIETLGSWRTHDPGEPDPGAEPWTPADVAGLLELHPAAYMDLGYRDGYPPGNGAWREKGRQVEALQAILASEMPAARSRICVTERPDMLFRASPRSVCSFERGGGGCDWEGDMDGEFGEQERAVKHAGSASAGGERTLEDRTATWELATWERRLLVLRPGRVTEEHRRVVRNTATTLEVETAWATPPSPGDRYEIRGSFAPVWVKRVSRAAHETTVRDLWTRQRMVCGAPNAPRACRPPAEPLDPFHPANHRSWPASRDRAAFEALATTTSVPALYGGVRNTASPGLPGWSDPYFQSAAVVMNVADADYREWRIRYLMYKLRDHGIQPGEPACISLTYKPGWYTYYDERTYGPSGDACAVPGSGLWTGPAHVCRDRSAKGGPLHAGLYGPGEYERAINSYIRELIARLGAQGWTELRIITTERPRFTAGVWSILDEDVRQHPSVIGEWMGPIEPSLAQLRSRLPSTPVPPATPGLSPPPRPQAAPPPASPPSASPAAIPTPPEAPAEAPARPTAPPPAGPRIDKKSDAPVVWDGGWSAKPREPRVKGKVDRANGGSGSGGSIEPWRAPAR